MAYGVYRGGQNIDGMALMVIIPVLLS